MGSIRTVAGWIRRAGRTGSGWLRRHWFDVLLPPVVFLLAAAVTRQLLWTWEGSRYVQWGHHYQAAMQAGIKGNREKALHELLAAAKTAPDDAVVHVQLIAGFQRLGQPERMLEHMEEAVRLSPPSRERYLALVRGFVDLGRLEEADRFLQKEVLPRWPQSAEAYYYRGVVDLFREKGDLGLRQAAGSFERCLRLDPTHSDARYQYGVCLSRLGQKAEAERALKQVLEAQPSSLGAYRQLARVLRQEGKIHEASQVLEKFRRLDEKERQILHLERQGVLKPLRPKELLELGGLYLDVDQPGKAAGTLARYTRQEPTDPHGHRRLAAAFDRLQQRDDARSERQLADALGRRAGGRP